MKLAIVLSQFNALIVNTMLESAVRAFAEEGLSERDVEFIYVPGAFEIPATIQKAIDTKKYDGILGLGCVVKGETDHYEYLCQGITNGMQKVAIENRFPVIFGILTVQEETLGMARAPHGYDYGKALLALVKTYNNLSA